MATEEQLLKELQSETQKEEAFRTLMKLYKERLYWHIRRMVLNHEDADDVLQNTFIKIYRNIHAFKGESKLYSWMYRIATNETITFLNKKSNRQQISLQELQLKSIDKLQSDVYFVGDEIQLKLQKAIKSLPQKQQLVFNMKYYEEFTYEELPEILDTSVGALKSSYHIAVNKITKFLIDD